MTTTAPEPQVTTYALDPTQVQVGSNNGPGLYLAPAGTAGPTDTVTPWPAAWSVLGYASQDGPTVGSSTNTNDIIPWQSIVPLMSVVTQRTVTVKFALWQLNPMTMALYFDADPPTPTGSAFSFDVRSDKPQHLYAVGIDAADTDQILRIVFPRAVLTNAADMPIKRGEAIPLEVTLTALDTAGVLAHVLAGPNTGTLLEAPAAGSHARKAA